MNSESERTTEALDALERRLNLMKQEVDGLQVRATDDRKPWFRRIPIVISILALLFSFGTTGVSLYRTWQQDKFDDRAELRTLIQRLGAMPRERIELMSRFEEQQDVALRLNDYLTNEHEILATQAAEIANRIPDLVSSGEALAIAVALLGAQRVWEAERFYALAGSLADSPNEVVVAYGSVGSWLIMSDLDKGRAYFLQAEQRLDTDYVSHHPNILAAAKLILLRNWSHAEARIGKCDRARELLAEAENQKEVLPSTPGFDSWLPRFEASNVYVSRCKENEINSEVPPD